MPGLRGCELCSKRMLCPPSDLVAEEFRPRLYSLRQSSAPFCDDVPSDDQLSTDERDNLLERGAAPTGVTHRRVLVSDRHAAEEDGPIRGDRTSATVSRTCDHAICGQHELDWTAGGSHARRAPSPSRTRRGSGRWRRSEITGGKARTFSPSPGWHESCYAIGERISRWSATPRFCSWERERRPSGSLCRPGGTRWAERKGKAR